MNKKVVIVLEPESVIEAMRIITDQDKDKALEFMRKYVEPAIRGLEHGHCRPTFEWQGETPETLKKLERGKKP